MNRTASVNQDDPKKKNDPFGGAGTRIDEKTVNPARKGSNHQMVP
jgi:hypothetical protein